MAGKGKDVSNGRFTVLLLVEKYACILHDL